MTWDAEGYWNAIVGANETRESIRANLVGFDCDRAADVEDWLERTEQGALQGAEMPAEWPALREQTARYIAEGAS